MPFTTDNLLLTPAKLAQLTAALANLTVAVPLDGIVTEAVAEVARYTAGFAIADDARNGWVRILALYKAYSLVGPVPEDLQKQNDGAVKELEAIAEGKRPNLPRDSVGAGGNWGSQTRITGRMEGA